MDREFRELYQDELAFLSDHAEEFGREFPGIADRLGGLMRDQQDPLIGGLLEGAAFLAARVQLKLKHEFLEFTSAYLEQLVPNFLAPTPSALLAQIRPPYGDPALRDGVTVERGELIEAVYVERERRVACRYQLRSRVTLWPFQITDAVYLPSAAALQALGLNPPVPSPAGLKLRLLHRVAATETDEPQDAGGQLPPGQAISGCRTDELTVHLVGPEADAVALIELVFANLTTVALRWLDRHGDPVLATLPEGSVIPVGLGDEDMLIPDDRRLFRGFAFIQDYTMFPRKFLGFTLKGLQRILRRIEARNVELVFAFNQSNPKLVPATTAAMFALYAAPAVNLFEKTMDRVTVARNRHEHQIVPDRTRPLDFEPYRITEVVAHLAGGQAKAEALPLYSGPGRRTPSGDGLYYTLRRVPRKRTARETTFGPDSDYAGTELFVSVAEPPGGTLTPQVAQLGVRGLCSNRHLPEQLPVRTGGVDFTLLSNVVLDIYCVGGPTVPRPPVVSYQANREGGHTGTVAWRLVNFLSLNQLGLVDDVRGGGAHNLRELLLLFCDPADAVMKRRIRSIRSLETRPIVRRIRRDGGFGAARGLEITVTVEDAAFEGSGAFVFGVVLERFFAEYVAINRFTQTILKTVERGVVKRWPPTLGTRVPL